MNWIIPECQRAAAHPLHLVLLAAGELFSHAAYNMAKKQNCDKVVLISMICKMTSALRTILAGKCAMCRRVYGQVSLLRLSCCSTHVELDLGLSVLLPISSAKAEHGDSMGCANALIC